MNKKLPVLFAICVLAIAGSAQALSTDELIAIGAMPLAVAEVAALPEVPRDEFISVVTTLNRAAVPAPQFIEVVRYAPVALVDTTEPQFVTFVTTEYERGIVGEPLAVAIADRYQTYGIREIDVVNPPVVTVVERQFLPEVVVTRFQPAAFNPLALIAMPLAVAAVSDLTGVPQNDLISLVTSLNRAMVPAPQFVEVVRYSPVVLVDRTASPQFIQFVTTEVDRGVFGRPLAFAIAERLETFEPIDIDLVEPLVVFEREQILPPVVVTRVARDHPHGGPPGQLKKQLGLQTGAEVVHGTAPRRTARARSVDRDDDDRVVTERRVRPQKVRVEQPRKQRVEQPRVKAQPQPKSNPPVVKQRGGDNENRGGGGKGGGQQGGGGKSGESKGKGKGKG